MQVAAGFAVSVGECGNLLRREEAQGITQPQFGERPPEMLEIGEGLQVNEPYAMMMSIGDHDGDVAWGCR